MKNYIYILTDPISNDVRYVGKSINPEVRARKHISEAKTGKTNNHRINWIKSLLNQNLRPNMEIIDETDDEWVLLEEYWISQFITWGFNLVNGTKGGENPPSWKGKTHSDEYKEIRRQKFLTDNPSKNMDDNWRKNISLAHKKNGFSPTKAIETNLIKVKQYNLNGEFIKTWNSLTGAANDVGLKNISGIREVCLNKRFKAGGFRWVYDGNELIDFVFKPKGSKGINQKTLDKAKEVNQIKVTQFTLKGEFIKTWSYISEASRTLNIKSSSGITEACKNKKFMCGGFRWTYLNEDLKQYKLSIGKSIKQLNLNGEIIKIWESTSEIKNILGFNPNCIAKACSGGLKTYKKYKWEWEEYKDVK